MAKIVLKDARVEVNAVVISDHIRSVTIETTRPEVDATAMGAVNTETLTGLGDASMTCEVYNDYAASQIDSQMFPLSQSNTPFTVKVRPSSAAIGAGNPEYTMSALLFNYSPIAGSVGEMAMTSLLFKNASQAGLTRAIA